MSHSTETLFVRIRRAAFGDLLLGLLVVLSIDYVVLAMEPGVFATTLLVLPLFLFVPGYAVLAALFPSRGSTAEVSTLRGPREMRATGIDLTERFILSYGVSLGLLPILGVALAATPLGLTRESIFGALPAIVGLSVAITVVRRRTLRADRQFQLPIGTWGGQFRSWIGAGSALDGLVNLALVVCVVGAVAMVGFAVLSPPTSAEYSEMSLLTESESGELVAGGTPEQVAVGEEIPVVLQVTNSHAEAQSYSVVVQVQRVNENGGVTGRQQLDRFQHRIGSDSQWRNPHTVAVPTTGDRLRVTYLLYEGQAPSNPTMANADKSLHFWVTATESGN
ncbi:DUF1616 domain-containing protein [Halobium palmae]|uniref:DUF1616 domain-containing protein n=1 Tax=Halobium palmae TaxID=1776492 RepID=A0ABD5S2H0_9EURY